MNTRQKILFLLLELSVPAVFAVTESERISALEKRVESLEALEKHVETLEATLNSLEPQLVARYGLKRNCVTPSVINGEALCIHKIKPGVRCSAVCNPGYIGTPGKTDSHCKDDGFWTVDLQCEIPLVLVSGGNVDQSNNGDSGVELLSFYPSKGCDRNISDMPLAGGSHRSLHNMIFVPPQKVLACNGMTGKHEATCDEWNVESDRWKHYAYPNKGCDHSWLCGRHHTDEEKGRYAAEGMHVGRRILIMGGMVYDGEGHTPSNKVRDQIIEDSDFDNLAGLSKSRAFFCAVKVKEGGFLEIGGLGTSQKGNVVLRGSHYRKIGFYGIGGLDEISKVTDMSTPR